MIPHRTAKSLRAAALSLLACAGAACERSAPAPSAPATAGLEIVDAQFPERPGELDFGRLSLGERATRSVRLHNASSASIAIRDVQAGCTCTQPVVSYVDPASGERVRGVAEQGRPLLSVPAGVTAELELTVDSSLATARNQSKLVVVRVTTDSEVTPFVSFTVLLFVESPFRPAPAVIDMRQVPMHGGGNGELALATDGLEGQRITGVLECPPELEARIEPQRIGVVDLWVVKVHIPPPVALGFRERALKLGTTGPGGEGEGRPLVVLVRATGVPDAAIDPPLVMLQVPEAGGPPQAGALVISRLPGQLLRVIAARVEGIEEGRIEAHSTPRAPDGEGRAAVWELTLRAAGDLGSKPLSGVLVVETDDPQIPRVQASWSYRP
jgi:hypothetical protein